MLPIYLWWIGADAADERLLEGTRASIAATFEVPAMVWDAADRPSDTWDARRGQHSSTGILRWLVSRRPVEASKVIAVTDVDLFIPVLTFVYGEAQLGGWAAVVSTARLSLEPDGRRLLRARLAKECIHELGHTFGLIHCDTEGCVMTRSVNIAAVDAKQPQLCADCRLEYLERLVRQGDDDAQGADTDPDRR
jgi:archaemetzincin